MGCGGMVMRLGKMFKGKQIYDSDYPLKIHVRAGDIETARRKDPAACALARCVIRDKHVMSARIGAKFALIEYQSHYERYSVVPIAKAISVFDKHGVFIAGKDKNKRRRTSGRSGRALIKQRPTRSIYRTGEMMKYLLGTALLFIGTILLLDCVANKQRHFRDTAKLEEANVLMKQQRDNMMARILEGKQAEDKYRKCIELQRSLIDDQNAKLLRYLKCELEDGSPR